MGDETPVNPPAPAPVGVLKKKKDEKYRKRDPRSWENIMRTTANMTLEERQQYLENIYNEMYNENRTSYANLQARDKQYTQCLREHEKDRAELTKSILARGQLESLCRELQKQNKLIKEENVARIKEEEDRRREVANTFTERLNALTNLITESKDKSNKVKEENQNMTQKLTELYEQYQQRENHLETVTRQLDLQKKLAETQAKKVEIEHEAERQTLLAQKKALELQLEQYEREIVLLQEKNRSLEAQVDLYKSQYSDFETTMSKSNKVFDTFKEEMSRMSKQLHILEAERNDLRKRWQSSVNSLIVLSEQHMTLTNEQSALEKRLQMLQKLCRQLQEDRSAFLKQLKENNIEPIVPSLKNGDSKENENEEQETEVSKSDSKTMKLKQDLNKVKKPAKMSDSDSSTIDLEAVPSVKVLVPSRSSRHHAGAAGPSGDHAIPSPEESSEEELPLDQEDSDPLPALPAWPVNGHSGASSSNFGDQSELHGVQGEMNLAGLRDLEPINIPSNSSSSSIHTVAVDEIDVSSPETVSSSLELAGPSAAPQADSESTTSSSELPAIIEVFSGDSSPRLVIPVVPGTSGSSSSGSTITLPSVSTGESVNPSPTVSTPRSDDQ